MTGVTNQITVRPVKDEVGLLIVIELPNFPPTGGVALITGRPESRIVMVIFYVTFRTASFGFVEAMGGVALLAGHRAVHADQRE